MIFFYTTRKRGKEAVFILDVYSSEPDHSLLNLLHRLHA